MKKFMFLFMVSFMFGLFDMSLGFCEGIEEYLKNEQIAVEKVTGRGGGYDNDFSGNVGSLRFDLESNKIYISELMGLNDRVSFTIGIFTITKLENYGDSMDFECSDNDIGIEWRGKVWLTDRKQLKIEMVMKESSRKWINLGEYGSKFLQDNHLTRLDLGQ